MSITLSNSYIRTLHECPQRFCLRGVRELTPVQQEEGTALLVGKVLHNVLTMEYIQPGKYKELELPTELQLAAGLLSDWLDAHHSSILFVETPILIPITSTRKLIIKPDFVLQDSEGVWIGDLKTTKNVNRVLSNYYNIPQIWVYLYSLQRIWKDPSELKGILLLGLTPTKAPTLLEERIPVTWNSQNMADRYLASAFRAAEYCVHDNWWPRTFNCVSCFSGVVCPYFSACTAENPDKVLDSLVQVGALEIRSPFEYLGPTIQIGLSPNTLNTKEVKICD